jgi:glycosyltransferase involved in cell wall biosynthesis
MMNKLAAGDILVMRVLMIGPGKDIVSGINTLVDVLVPVLEQRVTLCYFPSVNSRPVKKSGRLSGQNIILAFEQYTRFLVALFRSRPQIIHIHTSQGMGWLKDTFYILVGKLYGSKVVLHIHAADFDSLYGKRSKPVQRYTRWVMGLTDAIISVSDEWKQRLGGIVPAEKVFSFKNCINVDSFSTHPADHSGDTVQALFIGSVGSRKGAFDLLEALGRLKARGCVLPACIAGYEESEGGLVKARSRLQELHLADSCELPGTVLGDKKAELFARSNLFVLPSYNEGLPMAILEGMSAGMAVVSTPVGGIPEIVRDGYNGYLIQPGDIEGLAEKLEVLTRDPGLCQIMGLRSREIVEELDVKPYVARLITLYKSLLRNNENASAGR